MAFDAGRRDPGGLVRPGFSRDCAARRIHTIGFACVGALPDRPGGTHPRLASGLTQAETISGSRTRATRAGNSRGQRPHGGLRSAHARPSAGRAGASCPPRPAPPGQLAFGPRRCGSPRAPGATARRPGVALGLAFLGLLGRLVLRAVAMRRVELLGVVVDLDDGHRFPPLPFVLPIIACGPDSTPRAARTSRIPAKVPGRPSVGAAPPDAMAFAELSITSNFTFLTGGSHPQEYALRAIELGLPAFAIADRNSVAGIVRAHPGAEGGGARAARRRPAAAGRPALPRRRPGAHRAAARPRRLGPALPAADARRAAGREGRVPAARGGSDRPRPTCTCCCTCRRGAACAPGCRTPGRSPGAPACPSRRRARATTARTAPRIAGAARLAGELGLRARRLGRADDAPRQPPPAGRRADLHPRGPAHRHDRPGRARQRRAAAALRGRDAAAVRRPRGGGASRGRDRRGLPLRARRAGATSIRARSGTARTRRRGWSG